MRSTTDTAAPARARRGMMPVLEHAVRRPDPSLAAADRRAPVLQVGADVYWDMLLILREIECRFAAPTPYPAGTRGLAAALGWYHDTTLFIPATKLTTGIIGDGIPADFREDRIAFMGEDFGRAASLAELPLNRQRVAAQLRLIAVMIDDGRPYLLGDALSAADLAAYHVLWFVRQNGGAEAEAL